MTNTDSDPGPALDLGSLRESWELHLKAERKSPATLKGYRTGVEQFLAWARESGVEPRLDRSTVGAFMTHLLDKGAEPATAATRHLALRRFSAWLLEEGEIPADELLTSKPPKIDTKIVPSLTEDQLAALVKSCQGTGLRERRDEAILRLMIETGMRAGEVTWMRTDDLDLPRGLVMVRKSKTGKGRIVPVGPQTVRAIDRYIRARRQHELADSKTLWLGEQGKAFGYYGLYHSLTRRAEMVGIKDFHPHVLRHTAAARWLAAGGSEGGLMAVAGWTQRGMIDRYAAHTAASRAADEARGLNLGDL
ncbi:tyrosine-type recombinase/integrase [Rhodococcus aetherivorans]|uniref:tyrosine-type recombinase/integrase n=1 Tax=Rhodococcus aetherivorans TaxID=191292 RepID=UPI0026EFDB25|nr:tyrosine-type recombinase/integrase [Rhodococcus aetherivorans]WKW97323.1 tyrosine-type recombinase/integrase [Rhodococcus aetherivorans]